MRKTLLATAFLLFVSMPGLASAHEAYVLDHATIVHAVNTVSPNPFDALPGQERLFLFYGAAITFAIIVVLVVSISPFFERVCDPFLMRLKPFAPIIARITLGASLVSSGWFSASFGPELPFSMLVPAPWTPVMSAIFIAAGICVILGLLTRLISVAGVALFIVLLFVDHIYMLTYVSYLGEFVLFIILGSGSWSLDSRITFFRRIDRSLRWIEKKLEGKSFFIMRILFGGSIVFATCYAKFIHSNLALATVNQYGLTGYFHFTPLFLVLGAFLVEAMIGLFIILGIELRFTVLVFTFFLSLSILFFGEAVWPHVILFGANIALFFHGYDKYTVEKTLFSRARKGEPVL